MRWIRTVRKLRVNPERYWQRQVSPLTCLLLEGCESGMFLFPTSSYFVQWVLRVKTSSASSIASANAEQQTWRYGTHGLKLSLLFDKWIFKFAFCQCTSGRRIVDGAHSEAYYVFVWGFCLVR